LEFPNIKRGSIDKSWVPYILAIGKIMKGLLTESSNIMVLPLGEKMDPEGITSRFICLATSSDYRLLLKIITNKSARALNLLVKQSTEMHNTILQNYLALDYLFASEGGVCGKFNLSNCCLQIDDKGKVIKKKSQPN
jgi:hypothetical protein